MSTPSKADHLDREIYLSWIEVDLSAVRHNYRTVRDFLSPDVDLFPVVKADAYGHGAVHTVRVLEEEGARRVCVARVEEAIELRNAGININILVFSPPLLPQAEVAAHYGLEIVVCDAAHIKAVAQAQGKSAKTIPVHIKVDVGMGRIGADPDTIVELLEACVQNDITVRGIMSHFPCADAPDPTLTLSMISKFKAVRDNVMAAFPGNKLYFHTANTAAMLRFQQAHFSAVRSGISLYGQYPSYGMERSLPLRPAMTLKTRIIFLKDVPADTPVSYGHTYRTTRPSRIATLAIGYADGYPRHASNLTDFLVRGKFAHQVGRVCMDQLMIDVTNIPEVILGDEVTAFGQSGSLTLSAEEVTQRFDSLGYELTSRIGRRLPRFFIETNQPINKSNSPA